MLVIGKNPPSISWNISFFGWWSWKELFISDTEKIKRELWLPTLVLLDDDNNNNGGDDDGYHEDDGYHSLQFLHLSLLHNLQSGMLELLHLHETDHQPNLIFANGYHKKFHQNHHDIHDYHFILHFQYDYQNFYHHSHHNYHQNTIIITMIFAIITNSINSSFVREEVNFSIIGTP